MTRIFFIFFLFLSTIGFSQNIQVDSQTYSAQQLIEDILIDSNCIDNVVVTNVIGGDFGTTDKSYGYFDASGTTFPIQSGIVLSTGRLANVPGPNTSLSDDDAVNWDGDADLERSLSEGNTINATIIEFDFTAIADQISFRYLFASEEYQENNSNTCRYSDLFGFLIRPANEQDYTNIAFVPNTQTPVKVTTVHSGIPNGCPPINEFYFGNWNGGTAPINFNGQTKVMAATANIVPNQNYHVKLVIADAQNFRYDSAVFLEAGSFKLATNLGSDRLVSTDSALCDGYILELNAFQPGNTGYTWYKDGILVDTQGQNCPNCGTYNVTEPGTYAVEVTLGNNCISYGEIVVEYTPNPVDSNAILVACDEDQDGLTFYDLFDATSNLTNNENDLLISNFYNTAIDAINETDAIQSPSNFQNTVPFQTVYARIENRNRCFAIGELRLEISNNTVNVPPLAGCDAGIFDGYTTFDLNDITTSIQDQIPTNAVVRFYDNEADAFNEMNPLPTNFENTSINSQTIYVKISSNNSCFAITTTELNVLPTPILEPDTTAVYCLNSYPETVRLFGGVLNDSPSNYYYQWLFNTVDTNVNTSFIDINEIGNYTVIVTDPNGCSATRTITVASSDLAVIESIAIDEGSFNNTISVIVSGTGDYEFALDNQNGPYQDSSTFTGIVPGFHTVYVRDKNGCGITEELISVLGFPKYFTPNGDSFKDTWQIYGISEQFNRELNVKIYNRYGKLISQHDQLSSGWDGTFSGNPLPADDYWFEVTLADGKVYTGHFALVR